MSEFFPGFRRNGIVPVFGRSASASITPTRQNPGKNSGMRTAFYADNEL